MVTLQREGDRITLHHVPVPTHPALQVVIVLILAAFSAYGLAQVLRGSGAVPMIAVLTVGGAVAGIALVLNLPRTTRITSVFDRATRRIGIRREKSNGQVHEAEVSFDDVTELRLVRHNSKGTRLETLNLLVRDGRTLLLAQEQTAIGWVKSEPPAIQDLADELRAETGLPGSEPVPLPIGVIGRAIGIQRT